MLNYLISIVLSFAVTGLAGIWILRELRRLKAGQEIREEGPKWHASKAGTPTMGGLMFIVGTGVACLVLGWKPLLRGDCQQMYVYLFALIFGMIGFLDDFKKIRQHQNEGLTARQKLILQLVAAVVFLLLIRFEGMLTNQLYLPFVNVSFRIPWLIYLPFATFVVVGTVNAVNLTDGVDGLATSVTTVVMAFYMLVCCLWKLPVLGILPSALMGGLIAFFVFFNRHPAKAFMGDTGSLFLGGAVAAMAFALDMPIILIPVGIIYIAETLSVILQVGYFKMTHGKRLFKMSPIHHHFELCGWSENKLVVVFSAVTLVTSALALIGISGRF